MPAPLPPDEPTRVAALHRYRVLDTPPEREFDEMARLASALCETPMAAISFVAERRQWFKAEVGLGVRETGRDVSVCAHAILGDDEIFEIPDLAEDARTADNPHVSGPPRLRFYASAPLRSHDGRAIGALCVMDYRPRRLSRVQRLALRTLGNQVMDQLELRRLLSERIRVEQRASRERRHAELALAAGRMGLWELDPAAGVLRLGDGMDAIFGLEPSVGELDLAGFEALLAGDDDRLRVRAGIVQLCEDGVEMEVEFRIRRADTGETRWILSRGRRVAEAAPAPLLAGVCVDHTSRKLAEHRLLEADARKDEFLAMLAHELRNPLAPLANALHVLGRSPHAARERDLLEMADRQVHQLRRLVDDLLEVGRITRGKIALRCEPMTVDAAVRAAAQSTSALRDARRQRLEFVLPRAPLPIVADPVRVAQILENLLNNASKYTPEGGSIRIEAQATDDGVEVRVVDDGIGIEPAQLPFLFELFSQIDATLDRAQGGLGIGLAMVRRLVALHGGTVRADSAGLGRGSTFTVRLPRHAPVPPVAGPSQS